jgi:flagellar basal body rod protein FlgB
MQQAIELIDKNKVYIDTLQMEMIPVTVAYKAIELSFDSQINEAMSTIQSQLRGVSDNLQELTPDEND